MKISERLKEEVKQEILALYDEHIDNEIECMQGSYSVAEIAKECILSFNLMEVRK